MDALRQNDFEAYKELLRQTHGPQTDEDRFKRVLQPSQHALLCLTHSWYMSPITQQYTGL
jgi:hypothetical protein